MVLGESETVSSSPAFEQWDSYWEDVTRYTRLASCDIWGTKEVDFLGLDDFSSPYQDEEEIGRTPTLAQLNSEDSQPVCEVLYPPADLLLSVPQPQLSQLPCHSRRILVPGQGSGAGSARPSSSFTSSFRPVRSFLPDFPESSQRATRPVPSSTETMAKNQSLLSLTQDHGQPETKPPWRGTKMAAPTSDGTNFVWKAKVRMSAVPKTQPHTPSQTDFVMSGPPLPLSQPEDEKACTSANATVVVIPVSVASGSAGLTSFERKEVPVGWSATGPQMAEASQALEGSTSGLVSGDDSVAGASGGGGDEDYEADKDDDMSDTFSEPGEGCDMELMEDIKGLTAGVSSRKRGKRRYFWEYSEQLTPSKQERMLKPSEWDRHTLPSNLYQKNGPLHGKYMLKKSRRTDVEDLTPNPRKLLQIGTELRKLNKVISDLTPVSELPLTARPRSRKEKNKLASRACRLKKKAQYEANKVKLWGLSTEYDRLLFVINAIKEEIVARVEDSSPRATNMADTLEHLIQKTLVASPVAGETSDFVNKILETTGRGDPTGGLVGLRVPTSKM
ncbi:CREB3 regulatory factor [Liparis tanakae]|uniref:CREB3 regulatory factor n=1 Tax=Liparis tanakae TaxID=230148 RepID=A0A4Z2HNA9_9TELE|nr:CREB3 regulatory factor [Liparis tanakae]